MKFLLLLLISLQAYAFHPPLKNIESLNIVDGDSLKSDSGIYGPPYSEQLKNWEALAKNHNQYFDYLHYGQSVKKKPLAALLMRDKSQQTKISRLAVITGATHGNEYLNIVDQLPEKLLNVQSLKDYINKGGAVLYVPIVNPDGYENRSRHNGRWADLNRDWPGPGNNYEDFKQVETKSLADLVEKIVSDNNAKLDIAVDYHCCVDGTLLLPWGYKKGIYMSSDAESASKDVQKLFKSSFAKPGGIGTPPDILYSAKGTTLDYWHDKYNAISFTYEGYRKIENTMIKEHVKWWESIFNYLN